MRSTLSVLVIGLVVGCAAREPMGSSKEYVSVADYANHVVYVIPASGLRPEFKVADVCGEGAVPVVIDFFSGVAAAWSAPDGVAQRKLENLVALYKIEDGGVAGTQAALRDDVSGGSSSTPPSGPAENAPRKSNHLAPSTINALPTGPAQTESIDQVVLIDWLDRLADPELFDRLTQVHIGCL